jgi:glycosyltransferase involved in cell wall biosynthesis
LDNASSDETVSILKKELVNFPVEHEIFFGKKNLGFAAGQNFLWKKSAEEYVLFLNQDIYLLPDCLEKMVSFFDSHNQAAAVSPLLLKWNFVALKNSLDLELSDKNIFTDTVDSVGLQIFKNRRVVEGHTGKQLADIKKLYSTESTQVFGVSGTAPMFRRSVVSQIAYEGGEVFDETYWMYKEDFTQALEQFALALEELSKSNPKPSIQAEYLGHYGQALAKSGHTEGFAKLKEALQIIRTHRDLRPFHQLIVESGILLRLADAYISRHDLDNARSYLKEAKPLVDELAQEHGMEMRQNQFHNLVQSTKLSLE